eukprot:2759456-Rhodomonas_salina.1
MLMVRRARLSHLSGAFSELSKMCFGLRARAGYRVPSASSVGSSDETRFAAQSPAVPEFPEEGWEMRGMLEGRMRER